MEAKEKIWYWEKGGKMSRYRQVIEEYIKRIRELMEGLEDGEDEQ